MFIAPFQIMTTYGNFAAGLPEKVADSIVSPHFWSKNSSDNLRRSILIRSSIAIQSKLPKPVAGFKEIIEAAYHMPECVLTIILIICNLGKCCVFKIITILTTKLLFRREYTFIIKNISQVLQSRRDVCHDYWLEELMRMIQSLSSAKVQRLIKVRNFHFLHL